MVSNYPDEMKFEYGNCVYILDNYPNTNDRIRKFKLVKITDVVYHGEPDNYVYKLDENSPYYSDEQKDYIIRYKKFIKWLKDNEGKQFLAIINEVDIEDSRFDLPQFNAYDSFGITHYIDQPIKFYFLTDYKLIEIPKFDNIKAEKEWLRVVIISLNYYLLSNIDYQGRYLL